MKKIHTAWANFTDSHTIVGETNPVQCKNKYAKLNRLT